MYEIEEGKHQRESETFREDKYQDFRDELENVISGIPEEMKSAYVTYVKGQTASALGRKRYKELMEYLKKIKFYPQGRELAEQLAEEWKKLYYRRPAMMDELRKVGF